MVTTPGPAVEPPDAPRDRPRRELVVLLVLATVAVAVVALAPWVVMRGTARLAAWTVVVAGAGVMVGRAGALDLSAGATALAGAVAGAVVVGVTDLPPPASPLLAALAGGLVGAVVGTVVARVGRGRAVVPTVAVTVAAVGIVAAISRIGGAAGHHAVPFLAGGDRLDAIVTVVLAVAVTGGLARWHHARAASRLAMAVRAPVAAAALGRPVLADAATGAALGGAVTGLGGALAGHLTGSVSPTGHGLAFVAAVVVAVLVGGRAPLGPWLGAGLVWGPGLLWPLAVGRLPVALTTLPVALVALAVAGRGLLPARPARAAAVGGHAAATTPAAGAGAPAPSSGPAAGADRAGTPVLAATLPNGGTLAVEAGAVLALLGPNGSGKSTVLARLAGQLPDDLDTTIDGQPAPRGSRARRRAGVARTFQRLPDVEPADLARVTPTRPWPGLAAVETVAAELSDDAPTGAARDTTAWLAHLRSALAVPARVLLLDEPMPGQPAEVVAALVRGLADAGLAIVLVDHREAVIAVADDRVVLAEGVGAPAVAGRERASRRPPGAAGPRPGTSLELAVASGRESRTVRAEPGDRVVLAVAPAVAAELTAVLSATAEPAAPLASRGRRARRARGGSLDLRVTVAAGGGDARAWSTDRAARDGIAVVTDVVAPDVAVVEHLAGPRDDAIAALAATPLLAGTGHLPAGVLSGGERRVLGWLRAVTARPRAVVVTAPGHGLDPAARAWTRRRQADWQEAGVATIVVRSRAPDDTHRPEPRRQQ